MEPSNVVLLYLFRYCIICIDKILPGECVNRKFSLHIAHRTKFEVIERYRKVK